MNKSAIDLIVRDVAELPDRSSPDEWPEVMLVTDEELRDILSERLCCEDDDELVTVDWLVEHGWERGIVWPNILTESKQLLMWGGAGLWIAGVVPDQIPIALATTRGKLREVAAALGCKMTLDEPGI